MIIHPHPPRRARGAVRSGGWRVVLREKAPALDVSAGAACYTTPKRSAPW
jgi:hypothetical protein